MELLQNWRMRANRLLQGAPPPPLPPVGCLAGGMEVAVRVCVCVQLKACNK